MKKLSIFWFFAFVFFGSTTTLLHAQTAKPDSLPLSSQVQAFYYPWYGNPQTDGGYANWNHPVDTRNAQPRKQFPGGDDIGANFYPLAGCYSANNTDDLETQMKYLQQARVGVICASWWGKETFTGKAFPKLLDAALKYGIRVNVHIEPFPGRNAATTREAIVYILDTFGKHPAFYRCRELGNRPLFYIYDSYLIKPEAWAAVFDPKGAQTIRGTPYDSAVIGLWVKEHDGNSILQGGFDGFYTYFATDGFTFGSTPANWPKLAAWARTNHKLFIPSVGPGYVDVRIRPWNTVNTRGRENGAYYDRMFQAAIKAKPAIINITSFNEWHEGTQIEPATPKTIPSFTYQDYSPRAPGYYLERTAYWVEKFTKELAPPSEMLADNGVLTLKLDLTRGGAISYISKSGSNRSIVNIADEGRYIQQSYYSGKSLDRKAEGQSPAWSPWSWNPIQVGDAYRNRAKILDYNKDGNTLYVKCIPMLWDMNNKPAEAEMEQWTELQGNVLHARNRLTCHRTDDLYGDEIENNQELPAVYPISALKNLYTYIGNTPFTSASLTNPAVVNLSSGFWGVYDNVSEHWMAFVDENGWGMGIYNAKCTNFLAGRSGEPGKEAPDGSTSYIAPVKKDALRKNSVYEYEYYVIVGTLEEIRRKAYQLHAENLKAK